MIRDPIEIAAKARQSWLVQGDVRKAKLLYLEALKVSKENYSFNGNSVMRSKKRRRKVFRNSSHRSTLNSEQTKVVIEKISLLLLQSGKSKKAKEMLSSLGYTCRLSDSILNYPPPVTNGDVAKNSKSDPCIVIDDFVSDTCDTILRRIFGDPKESYWKSHNYEIEPPSPYFSYVIPVNAVDKLGFIGKLCKQVISCKLILNHFPALRHAKFVEMWAHNRPHASGHQMHFDSDDEGNGGVRNPIISTILYIRAESGGPSLVTQQSLNDRHLSDHGFLSHPARKRLVAFSGNVLHGVIPGKGSVSKGRRVTLMLAFWKHIEVREGNTPGSARPFPLNSNSEWAQQLLKSDKKQNFAGKMKRSPPLKMDCVYETLDGKPWNRNMGLPDYDHIYQGF